jgi:hypothetical protein
MAKQTIANIRDFLPTETMVKAIDENFTEVYAAIATNPISTLTEYADNAAAVSGGLAVGQMYTTTGTVKVVTA